MLLVDDDPAVRMTFAALLEDAGYRVTEAASLKEARAMLAASALSLAVLDLDLGDGKGGELISELRAAHPGITIALLSGAAHEAPAGCDLVLSKGDAPDELIRRLKEHAR